MSNKTVFCEQCRDDVFYKVVEENITADIKGEEYKYYGKKALCNDCGCELYVSEINDYNLNQLYREIRVKNNIIPLENILEITEKYNIGKRPLSLLLGWGEQTFSRYCDGDMPTKQYSDILKRIYEEPKYYLSVLEDNKDRLKSMTAYEKSKATTMTYIESNEGVGIERIDSVINYILAKCQDITPLALQKILYYVQGFCYAFTDKFLLEEDCEAWVHGPVFRDIYYKYKDYRFDPIGEYEVKEINIPLTEKVILDGVIKNFGCYSGKVLEAFTHEETPWLSTRGDLPELARTNRIIEKKLIAEYFKEVKVKCNMINATDIGRYSTRMFKQSCK